MKKEHVITEALSIYRKLATDDQDSVRVLTIQDLVAIGQQLTPAEVKDHLLTQIRQSLTDKSWRVRYMVSTNFVDVSLTYIGVDIGLTTIIARRSCRPRSRARRTSDCICTASKGQ
jgi:hypothetical protein